MAESKKRIGSVGQQVGDYHLLRLLGGGGFGEVYLAEHVHNHTAVAVKILQAHLTQSEDLKAFINEARTFRLKHPHIVPILDFGIMLRDVPYLVMEYAPHGTLRERHPPGTQLPLPIVVSYVNQIASALQYAHDLYLIHRDVKPANMLVGANGEILLTDFGIAAVAHNSYTLNNQPEGIGGTASYMAPEQIEGKPRPASDQYALGILTYEWLSGQKPFQGTPMEVMMQQMAASPLSLTQQVPMLTAEIERVVFTALAKDPKQRFSSIRAFATAFEEVAGERTIGRNVSRVFTSERMEHQERERTNHQFMPQRLDTLQSSSLRQDTLTVPYREDPTPNVFPAVQQRRKPRGFLVGIVALVLLLILGGSTTFVLMAHSNNAQISATATATAISHVATSTVTSHLATSTATSLAAAATATATAQLTSVADFTTQAPGLTNMTLMANDSVFAGDHSVLFPNQQVVVTFTLQPQVNAVSLSLRALVSQNGPNNPGSSPISIYCNDQVVVANYTMPGNGYSANTTSIQIPMQQLTQGSNQLRLVIASNAQTAFWLYTLSVTQTI